MSDFSRATFNPRKHYSGVLLQQGRLLTDADVNEQVAIGRYRTETEAVDVIGRCGYPKGYPDANGSFAIGVTEDNQDLTISAGRYYVGGLLCENDEPVTLATQPDFPAAEDGLAGSSLPDEPGRYVVYLDAWHRPITAIEDPEIREPALGGVDTSVRERTTWQVRLSERPLEPGQSCADWQPPEPLSTGRMIARTVAPPLPPEPCVISPTAGYRGLENQLYRVEIHRGGTLPVAPGEQPPTIKWSRDNGSVVTAINVVEGQPLERTLSVRDTGRDEVLGFAHDQWVEIIDERMELTQGHGQLARIESVSAPDRTITLVNGSTLPVVDAGRAVRLRRWDNPAGAAADGIPIDGGPVDLEHGLQVEFTPGVYRAGDYWLIPARTAIGSETGDIEWPEETALPAHGIVHHACPLAVVEFDGEGFVAESVVDCRDSFPTLTGICAEDICFDNEVCDLPEVETVQDVLEHLCRERDLRFHNKHLHGWGIVCGLAVTCGPDDEGGPRENVTVHQGYAIDCEGNDLVLDEDQPFAVLEAIRRYDQEHPDDPILDENGNGDASLTLELDPDRGQRFGLRKYNPSSRNDAQALLAGTLLMNFYNDCVLDIQRFIQEQLEQDSDQPAGRGNQLSSALTNLVAQPINPKTGQNIYLSPREHKLLAEFYAGLRAKLQSETFCAMFENARPLPDYPLDALGVSEDDLDTIFGTGLHVRIRVRPGGAEAYTVGPGANPLKPTTRINRYDLRKRRLVAEIDPVAGGESGSAGDAGVGAVQDVAFSQDGKLIYMIASTRNDENTIFRVGEIGGEGINWRPMVTICGVKLITLATTPADPANVYAIGWKKQTITNDFDARVEFRGAGLYRINPENVDPNMAPLEGTAGINFCGHLVISRDGRAFATFQSGNVTPATYDRIKRLKLPEGAILEDFALKRSGRDDIAIWTRFEGAEVETLFVVEDDLGQKVVQAYALDNGRALGDGIGFQNTSIRLAAMPSTRMLLVTLSGNYSLRMIDANAIREVDGYLLPIQVGAAGIVADPETRQVYVLNQISNTITVASARLFDPGFRFRMDVLAAYRKAMIEAYTDLLGGFLQYLKDCLCHHFLVNCPECPEDPTLYLACVSVRQNQVYKVCNFSLRRYVKSFPTVGYWLSLVPIMPMIDRLIEEFCCMVLPDLFAKYTTGGYDEENSKGGRARLEAGQFNQLLSFLQGFDVAAGIRDLTRKFGTAGSIAGASFGRPEIIRTPRPQPTVIRSVALVNQPVEVAEAELEKQGIRVRRAVYDPARTPNLAGSLAGFFRIPQPGREVILYEQDGRVRYYSVADVAPPVRELRSQVTVLSETLQAREAEIQGLRGELEAQRVTLSEVETLRATVASTQQLLARRDEELGALRAQLQGLERRQVETEGRVSSETLRVIEDELRELRAFREEVRRFMEQPPE